MEKVFLDANILIDLLERKKDKLRLALANHPVFVSPLSIHIICYAYKYTMPQKELLEKTKDLFTLVPFDEQIAIESIQGPTSDFEDNVQLHSAAEVDCDFFLTRDAKLLALTFFGKTHIVDTLTQREN